ncbi:MAG: alpha/beta hydrolase, partial [Frankia sp.]|nr:alpha/beta hydrolase [Frankia sp.]
MIPVVLLPGGIMPAALAYADLISALGDDVDARAKELELYAGPEPPADYSLALEVAGVARVADEAGFDRFHLVGYSAGGAVAVMFATMQPERLLSLTLNEPAWAGNVGMSAAETAVWSAFQRIGAQDGPDMIRAFTEIQLAPGVAPPAAPAGAPPPWMAQRPRGIATLIATFRAATLDLERLR